MKKATVIVRKSPFNTLRNSEALRMGVGLTLRDNEVMVVFIDDGVHLLRQTSPSLIGSPEVRKHIEAIHALGHKLIAERESLEERGIESVDNRVDIRPRAEIANILAQSDAIIVY